MTLPTKHTNLSKSLLGFGSYVLNRLESPGSIDDLWKQYQVDYKNKQYLAKHSFVKREYFYEVDRPELWGWGLRIRGTKNDKPLEVNEDEP